MRSPTADGPDLNLSALRARLAGARGPRYWRCLEEWAETPEFQAYLGREFPSAEYWTEPASRRTFLTLMAASLALAGVGGCSSEVPEKIVPYVRAPEQIVPGKPLWFATALTLGGFATGVLVESHQGRPTFVAGNEKHPESLGAIDPFAQAAVLGLYDPDRAQVVMQGNQIDTWDAFLLHALAALDAQRPKQGAGLRVLTETVTSPTLGRQLKALRELYPKMKWHQYEPVSRDNARAGALQAFDRDAAVRYRFDKADRIVALDADFLATGPGRLRHARDFASRREPRGTPRTMNRLYVVEAAPSVTGAMADHRLAIPAHRVAGVAHVTPPGGEVRRAPTPFRPNTPAGSPPSPATCSRTRGPPSSSRGTASPPSFTPWPTRSTRRWGTRARRSTTPTRSSSSRSIKANLSARSSATSTPARSMRS